MHGHVMTRRMVSFYAYGVMVLVSGSFSDDLVLGLITLTLMLAILLHVKRTVL